jgi:hypothetical protein
MTPPFASRLTAMCVAALLAPVATGAQAQQVAPDRNASAAANIFKPATVQKLQDLDFGAITVTTAGTAVLDPNTDAVAASGGVTFAGGLPHAAQFEAISPTGNVVIIRLPRSPATLTRAGGTETMTIDDWTMDGPSRRTVVARQPFTFKVGGTLYVGANQVEGTYTGTFEVDVQFP